MEHFDFVMKSLDYQIEDYRRELGDANINFAWERELEIRVSNRNYAKEQILLIKERYHRAKREYDLFCESDKPIFDLYVGQNVKNSLVKFEVAIHNIFIAGRKAEIDEEPLNNIIKILRVNLVNSMCNDIGN